MALACAYGHLNIAELLMNKYNCDIEMPTKEGKEPWELALQNKNINIYTMIMKKKLAKKNWFDFQKIFEKCLWIINVLEKENNFNLLLNEIFNLLDFKS